MEAIIFIGIQATGKSAFYQTHFGNTHVRINMDMLKTRHREKLLLRTCLEMVQPFVVDNTNPTRQDRARYIIPARQARFRIIGYYFQSNIHEAIQRNSLRIGPARVPEKGIRGTYSQLELPALEEGFDELFYVKMGSDNTFIVDRWQDEI